MADNIIGWLNSTPPAGVIWITISVVVFRLVWDLGRSIYNRLENRKLRLRSIEDEYWYRNQLLPLCLQPLIEFTNDTSENLTVLAAKFAPKNKRDRRGAYLDYLVDRIESKNLLLSRFRVLEVLNVDVYAPVSEQLDFIEEILIQHCHANSDDEADMTYEKIGPVFEDIFHSLKEIFGALISAHKRLRP